jgi:hypothetical protein
VKQYSAAFWEASAVHKRFLRKKLCLAESENEPCNSPIIQAHTVPRSQLQQIAQDGHVYSFDASIDQLAKTDGKISARKFGTRQFSVLHCFCALHDKSIFADIEDVSLIFSPRQIALLHYRTTASELYRKIRAYEAIRHHTTVSFQKLEFWRKKSSRPILDAMVKGQELGLRDAKVAFEESTEILERESYDCLSALIINFNFLPSVMTVGGFLPEFDYHGHNVQDLGDEAKTCEIISFNILSSDGCAAIAFIWRKGRQKCLAFAKSYAEQPASLYTTLAIQTAFEHIENTCMRPEWWERLKQVERDLIAWRMQTAGSHLVARQNNCLQYTGVTHDDWDFKKLLYLNC